MPIFNVVALLSPLMSIPSVPPLVPRLPILSVVVFVLPYCLILAIESPPIKLPEIVLFIPSCKTVSSILLPSTTNAGVTWLFGSPNTFPEPACVIDTVDKSAFVWSM